MSIILKGQVLKAIEKETPQKKVKLTNVQILMNDGDYPTIENITDWENKKWEIGKACEISVRKKLWVSKRGNPGISWIAV